MGGLRPLLRPLLRRRTRWSQPCLSKPFTARQHSSSAAAPIPPPPPTSNHHNLQSFLDYAERTSLSPQTTTFVGTHYEYTILESLRHYSIDLTRIGGRADSGIDLVGTWALPFLSHPLRLLVQCKAVKAKVGPNLIRELEGTFPGAPMGWRGEGIVGMLVSTRGATKGVRDTLANSRYPLVWVLAELDGRVRQILWNQRAAEIGLEGLEVLVKHGGESDPTGKSIALAWDGKELEPLTR